MVFSLFRFSPAQHVKNKWGAAEWAVPDPNLLIHVAHLDKGQIIIWAHAEGFESASILK